MLALLDMSSAFDCVNYKILLDRLFSMFGIAGDVLNWLETFLVGRSQEVCFLGKSSRTKPLTTGVPQGSVLGPLLFLVYISPVFDEIEKFGLKCHGFADDLQLSISAKPLDVPNALNQFRNCMSTVNMWLGMNRLKLNQDKTRIMLVGTWQQLSTIKLTSVSVCDMNITFSNHVSNLGFILDSHMSMGPHIALLIKSCSFQLRQLRQVRKSLNKDNLAVLVHAFVHSRLDYCNSLLYGIANKWLMKLQVVQNQAAKLICGGMKFGHASPLLQQLHWLPVQKRVLFKLGVMVFRCLNDLAPQYLSEKCKLSDPVSTNMQLRSVEQRKLFVRC